MQKLNGMLWGCGDRSNRVLMIIIEGSLMWKRRDHSYCTVELPARVRDIVIHTFLYGIFFVLNLVAVCFICFPLQRRAERGVGVLKKPMFVGAVTLFATVTSHWACNVLRLFEAMVFFKQGASPLEYYADLSHRIYAVKTGLIMASVVTGDTIMIYRLWVVWNCQYHVIILPIVSAIGVAISGSGITYQLTQFTKGKTIFASSAKAWVICEALFTILTNVYCTSLIAWRIWFTNRHSSPLDNDNRQISPASRRLMAALVIIIESALLYSSFLIVFIGTYVAKHEIESLIVDCLPPVAGIAFSFINVRAYLLRFRSASQLPSTVPSFRLSRSNNEEELAYPMQPFSVHIGHDSQSSNSAPTVEAQK